MQGWVELGRGNFDSALATLEPLAAKQNFEMYHAYHSALMRDISGQPDMAAENYRLALTAVPGGTLRVVVAYTTSLRRAGRVDEANSVYQSYRENHPDSPWLEPILSKINSDVPPEAIVSTAQEGMAEALFGAASALPNESAGDTGLIYAYLALHLRPDFPVVQLLVGEVLDVLERYEDAIEAYSGIAKDSPYSWSARLRAASDLASVERLEEAVNILSEMVAENPQRSDAAIALETNASMNPSNSMRSRSVAPLDSKRGIGHFSTRAALCWSAPNNGRAPKRIFCMHWNCSPISLWC
jgi:tetratricopeptide (TPR) repeat protein